MAAVYPGQFKTFSKKVNFIEDVDASHVNQIQDEISAIERTLGANPHLDVGMYAPGRVINYGTVSNRIAEVARGTDIPVCSVKATPNKQKFENRKPELVDFHSVNYDTHGMHRSSPVNGIYCPRSGIYNITAYLHVIGEPIRVYTNNTAILRIFKTAYNYNSDHHVMAHEHIMPPGTRSQILLSVSTTIHWKQSHWLGVEFWNAYRSPSLYLDAATLTATFVRDL